MEVTVQYWQRTVHVDEEEPESSVKNGIRGNMNMGIRTEELKYELESMKLEFVWQN